MTDFLTRLLDRARGQALALERRRPQLFEPAPVSTMAGPAELLPSLDVDEGSEQDQAPVGGRPGVVTLASTQSSEGAQTRSYLRKEELPPALAVAAGEGGAPRPDPPDPTAFPRTSLEGRAPPSGRVERSRAAAGLKLSTRPATPEAAGEARPAWTSNPRTAPRVREPELGESTTLIEASSKRPVLSSVIAVPRGSPAIPSRVLGAARPEQGELAPFAHIQARVPPASVGSPAAPTVHVTIGRIEVRAVPGPPQIPRGSVGPAGPRLSLEAYLRSRAGAGK